jgi:broad specificity phosphatase PhoE
MVEIWFEPHATTPDNEAKRGSGWNDVDLSELGYRRAVELIDRCRSRELDAVFCSDLQRAVKTAIPTVNALHLPLYIDERLRECNYGDMEHAPNSFIDAERPNRIETPFPNGESYEQCMQRMSGVFDWLRQDFDGQTILMIGHRATHYGVEHFGLGTSLEDCIAEHWEWQPGWLYRLQ